MKKLLVLAAFVSGAAVALAQTGQPSKPTAPGIMANERQTAVKVKGFQPPAFPGGKDTMYAFLGRHMRYPAKAMKDRVQGDVFVKFTVKKDGAVANPKVISGLDPECDKEAVRVLLSMPAWIPGKQDDKPVEMTTTVPVRFVLDK